MVDTPISSTEKRLASESPSKAISAAGQAAGKAARTRSPWSTKTLGKNLATFIRDNKIPTDITVKDLLAKIRDKYVDDEIGTALNVD